MARPSAAEALFGHLPHRSNDVPKQQTNAASLAAALYPSLAQKTEAEARERNRKTILPDLPGTKRRRK